MFQYKDHLGNVRVSYAKNTSNVLEIIEENNYYPFGLKHEGYNPPNLVLGNNEAQKYKYNGKELQDELGLGVYDYGARNYDPALGRFMTVDPLAELTRRFNPYTYALNNPVYFIDPDGREANTFFHSKFLNQNGGHWSDQYRSGSAGEDNSGDSTSENSNESTSSSNESYKDKKSEDEPPVNLFGVGDSSLYHGVFNKQFEKYAWTEGDGIFRVYGHGQLAALWDDTVSKKGVTVYNPKKVNAILSKKSVSWAKAMKENKNITLILYTCSSASPDGKSIAQKISKMYNNITVVGFTGYVMYSPTGEISGVSQEYPVNGVSDGKGEQVTYRGGKEVPGSRAKFKKN